MPLPTATARSLGELASAALPMTTPRGHDAASRPPAATTRREPSATASTSAPTRSAILLASRCTVASSSSLVASLARAALGQPGIERGLQRRVLGQRRHRRAHVLLPARLDLGEHLLRGRQVVGHGLPHLIADAQAQHREHRAQHERHRQERRHQRAREQPRRLHCPGSSTGSVKLICVAAPARIVTRSRRSPMRSCHATSV